MSVPFTLKEIDHVVLRTANLERMMAFYCDVLGCTLDRAQEEIGLYQLRAGRSLIDLVDVNGTLGRAGGGAPGADARNMDHFCIFVEPVRGNALISPAIQPTAPMATPSTTMSSRPANNASRSPTKALIAVIRRTSPLDSFTALRLPCSAASSAICSGVVSVP